MNLAEANPPVDTKPPAEQGWRGKLSHDEPMRRHTSWRTGGTAELCYAPADLPDLATFLATVPRDVPIFFVGLGSNLLVRDGGLRGLVILLHNALRHLHLEHRCAGMAWRDSDLDRERIVYAEAGVASPRLARFAANHNLVGAEFLAGIPGTIGGALAMNAGCYGGETWNRVAQVVTVSRTGVIADRLPADFEIGYRHVALRRASREEGGERRDELVPHSSLLNPDAEEWFAAAWFRLPLGDGEASRDRIAELLRKRAASQPLGTPNAGSVFRNPPGDHAARLIESAGLKGRRIGGAEVSGKHANFIVNTGTATAADIEALVGLVEETVAKQTGVRLVREVRIVGEPA